MNFIMSPFHKGTDRTQTNRWRSFKHPGLSFERSSFPSYACSIKFESTIRNMCNIELIGNSANQFCKQYQLSANQFCLKCKLSVQIGHVTLAAITRITILVLYTWFCNSLEDQPPEIRSTGADLQTSGRAWWQDTRIATPEMGNICKWIFSNSTVKFAPKGWIDRNEKSVRVTALVVNPDAEACLQHLQWRPGQSSWWLFHCIEKSAMVQVMANNQQERLSTESIINQFNTLWPRQNGRRFADDTFKRIFLNKNVRISIKISLKFLPKGPINNNPALVQIMAWRRSGDKPLSELMMVSLLTHICVTWPQWVRGVHMHHLGSMS